MNNPQKKVKLSKSQRAAAVDTIKKQTSTQKGFDYTFADNIRVARRQSPGKVAVSFRKKEGTVPFNPVKMKPNTNYKSSGSKKGKAK